MTEVMKNCSRYSFCSANRCPLDLDVNLRDYLEGEEKCGMAKSIRLRIGTKYGLPKLGLTDKEFSARKRWEDKSEEEKSKIRSRLAKSGFKKQS